MTSSSSPGGTSSQGAGGGGDQRGAAAGRVVLAGSDRSPAPGLRDEAPLAASSPVEVTLVLRRRAALPADLVTGTGVLARAQLAQEHGADPADVAAVTAALEAAGLEVTATDAASRRVQAQGPASAVSAAFGTQLTEVTSDAPGGGESRHRHREGALTLPEQLDGVVVAVLGLDDRPQARSQLRAAEPEAVSTSYTPLQLGRVYRFPTDHGGTALDGAGQRVAVLELGGGFGASDLTTYFSGLGIAAPTVTAVGVDGGRNVAGQDPSGADGEVLLDVEVAGALAPGAEFVVYFAPNTDRGFLDALATAAHAAPTPSAISISWGGPEESWTAQARRAFDDALADAAALGVTVLAAAGDNGSSDGVTDGAAHTDFPASSPHALACGGTSLHATGTAVRSEVVWNGRGATGGGVSTAFARPAWQAGVGVPARAASSPAAPAAAGAGPSGGAGSAGASSAPSAAAPERTGGQAASSGGRGVPDVAAVADPVTGYQVLVDGKAMVIGGTSAVAPLWSALVARLVQARGGRGLGLLAPLLYAGAGTGTTAPGFRDITEGDNGAYSAVAGWDACTGLGVPDGEALLARLLSA